MRLETELRITPGTGEGTVVAPEGGTAEDRHTTSMEGFGKDDGSGVRVTESRLLQAQ